VYVLESFFGHMKDELEYEDCQTIEELRERVNEYVLMYTTTRYQWGLKKMTPDEYGGTEKIPSSIKRALPRFLEVGLAVPGLFYQVLLYCI